MSPHGVYSPADVDVALARVFGPGVRPLRMEDAVFEAMLDGWRAQQTARYLKPKTIQHNERGVRAFVGHVGRFPWEWRTSDADEYFEDLLSRPQRLARSTLRAYQWRLKGLSEYVCDRRYPWTVICEREFARAPGQLFDERNLVAHRDRRPPHCCHRPRAGLAAASGFARVLSRAVHRGALRPAPAGHPLAGRSELALSELEAEPFLALPEAAGLERDFWLAAGERSAHPTIAADVASAEETFEAVAGHVGVALVAAGNAALYPHPDIVAVPVRENPPAELAVAWRAGDDQRLVDAAYEVSRSSAG